MNKLTNKEDNKNNFIDDSYTYNEKINGLESQFFSVLEDFKKYYVYYNKNPEVNEFQNYYSESKSQLQKISKNIINITNEIHKKIETLDEKMTKISKIINKDKQTLTELELLKKQLENTENGSEILIDDTKTEYNKQYYININLLVGISLISIMMIRLFRKQ